jgi:hypothetical protein
MQSSLYKINVFETICNIHVFERNYLQGRYECMRHGKITYTTPTCMPQGSMQSRAQHLSCVWQLHLKFLLYTSRRPNTHHSPCARINAVDEKINKDHDGLPPGNSVVAATLHTDTYA